MKNRPAPVQSVTLIPPHRASTHTPIEVRLWCPGARACRWSVLRNGLPIECAEIALNGERPFRSVRERIREAGDLEFVFEFLDDHSTTLGTDRFAYEVVATGVRSTRRIDGCWVSILHWSEEEARHFNADLKRLAHDDWKDQVRSMGEAGIKTVLIQNVFDSAAYAGRHEMSVDDYRGTPLYPSELYPNRYPLASEDPILAILEAADECGMTVFLGVGLFAWFDFSSDSLAWHKRVTRELYDRYGGHPSLYGWYISEEMFGSLYDEWDDLPNEAYRSIVGFFREYSAFVRELGPTKPVALAPNNIRFHEFAREWGEILANVDILIPFAFARDPENMNIRQIQEICDRSGTHFWVDMEMFAFPLDDGLKPKTIDQLLAEIRTYDDVEQIFGYQFTGIMNFPASPHDLGGDAAKRLYSDYLAHLSTATAGFDAVPDRLEA